MTCNTCKTLVYINATGVCLACQMQNGGVLQQDQYKQPIVKKSVELLIKRQKEIEKELENANEV